MNVVIDDEKYYAETYVKGTLLGRGENCPVCGGKSRVCKSRFYPTRGRNIRVRGCRACKITWKTIEVMEVNE